jgi:hypothetical protein
VIRLGCRGPLQAFSFIDGLGTRKTGDDDDAFLPLPETFSVLGGDEDLARCSRGWATAIFLSHGLESAVGKPMLAQNSSSRSPSSRPPSLRRGMTLGSSSSPHHATSSATEIPSSSSDTS